VFERFTERARQVVVLAQDEARLLKHNYLGTEHLLLGLLREEEGLAARVLESFDVTLEEVRAQVRRIIGEGAEPLVSGQIPFTPRAKKALELALRESQSLGHNYIGTEHILLGLVREGEGVAARILVDFDADLELIRNKIIGVLSGSEARAGAGGDPKIAEVRAQKEAAIESGDFELAARLRDVERKLIQERRGALPEVRPGRPGIVYGRRGGKAVWAQWPSMLTGAALLGLGILVGWAIWG